EPACGERAADLAERGAGCDSGGALSGVPVEWRAYGGADDDYGEFSDGWVRVLAEGVRTTTRTEADSSAALRNDNKKNDGTDIHSCEQNLGDGEPGEGDCRGASSEMR